MNRKGLVAMLDALLAYTVAFISIGLVVLLMTNTQEADVKTTYTLNVWAEDLADAVGASMVPDPAAPGIAWKDEIHEDILRDLDTSLENIASEKGLSIFVQAEGVFTISHGSIDDAEEIATAKRFLTDDSGNLEILTVKVGL